MAYGIFGYNKNKEELALSTEIPLKIFIEKSSETDNKFLALIFENGKIGSVIEQDEIEKLKSITNLNELIVHNMPINNLLLSDFSFEYRYWKDKLYELKVNDNIIIEFKKENNTIAYVVLILGLFWTTIQVWVLITLASKGMSIYDKAFKN